MLHKFTSYPFAFNTLEGWTGRTHTCGQRPDYRFSYSKLSASVKHSRLSLDFPGGSDGKESTCNAGDLGSILGLGRSLGEGMVTHSSILAWRIPWLYSPWGHKELDITEWLHFLFLFSHNIHFKMTGLVRFSRRRNCPQAGYIIVI